MHLDTETHTLTVEEELIAMCREIERLYRQNSDLQDENETLRQHLHTVREAGEPETRNPGFVRHGRY